MHDVHSSMKNPTAHTYNTTAGTALTVVACKLRLDVQDYLDPFQFACRQGRGTDDAVNTVVLLILKHLDKPKACARLFFIDFSWAFNLIQPYTLLTNLKQMNVNPYIIKWYHSLIADRVQLVKVNQTLSQTVVTMLCQFADFEHSVYK